MAREPRIKPYTKAAGGWDSLISSVQHLLRAGNPGRGAKTLLKLNQEEGFDCPGCAWGDPEHTSSFEFCENGVKAVAWESTSKRVTQEFFENHTLAELATWDGHSLEREGRLTEPMAYNAKTDKYEPITWPRAFAIIGRELNKLESPDEACPGCAWGDPEHTSSFEFCENGVKAVAWESTSKRVTQEFFENHTLAELATWDGHSLEREGRLTEPMAYNAKTDKYEPITWPRAFAIIGRELNKLESPDEAAFYTSGRTSNEAVKPGRRV